MEVKKSLQGNKKNDEEKKKKVYREVKKKGDGK